MAGQYAHVRIHGFSLNRLNLLKRNRFPITNLIAYHCLLRHSYLYAMTRELRTHGTNGKGEKWTAMLRGMWNLGSSLSFPSVPSLAFFISWNGIAFGKIGHAQTKYPRHRKTKIQEPVSSTSGRDAREMYHDISS